MQGELHGNLAYHGVELLVLVSMLFLLAIPRSILILKEFWHFLPRGVGQGHVCPQNGRRGCSLLCILPILAKSRHISRNMSHRLFLSF